MVLLADPPNDMDTQSALNYLGKALYVACKFEEFCQQLTFILEIRSPTKKTQSQDESFNYLIKLVNDKLFNLNKFISAQAKLNEDCIAILCNAREARNYIAHEAIRDFELRAKMHDGLSQWKTTLADNLNNIAVGIAVVSVLLSRHISVPEITNNEFESYPDKVKLWVFGKHYV